MQRFPEIQYTWKVTTPGGAVDLCIAPTQWDQAGAATIRLEDSFGHYLLRKYFLTHGQGMYGHAIDIDDKMMIPEDIHHILLMNETLHHRTDLIQSVEMVVGFIPDEAWLEYVEENAFLMDDD